MEVKSALTASEAKIQQLLKVNCHLSEELRLMQSKVSAFTSAALRKDVSFTLQYIYICDDSCYCIFIIAADFRILLELLEKMRLPRKIPVVIRLPSVLSQFNQAGCFSALWLRRQHSWSHALERM